MQEWRCENKALQPRRTAPYSLGRGRHYWGKLPEKFANPTLGKVGEGGQVGSEGWKWGGNMRRWSPYYCHIGNPRSLGMGEVLGEFQGVVEHLIWNLPTSSHQHNDWDFKVKSWIFLDEIFPLCGGRRMSEVEKSLACLMLLFIVFVGQSFLRNTRGDCG